MLGRLTALALVKQGYQVALHDSGGREGAQSAAYVAAAMLAPMAEAVDATALVLALGRQSLPLWHDIVRTLKSSGSWTQVQRTDGRTGWVAKNLTWGW